MQKSPRAISLDIVGRVLNRGAFSNILLARTLENSSLKPEQKRRINALTLGTLRNCILLERLLDESAERKWAARPVVRTAGLLGAFEILFFESVPDYAAVNEYVKLASARSSRQEASFLNACLRRVAEIDIDNYLRTITDPVERLALETSHPSWMAKIIFNEYGIKHAAAILRAACAPLPFYLRTNSIRTTPPEIVERFIKNGISATAHDAPPECIAVAAGMERFPLGEHSEGLITLQDRSTQLVPHFLSHETGDEVLDLCCGSGMKSTHIAEIQGDSGLVVAVDRSAVKIRSLKNQALRLGIRSIKASAVDILEKPTLGSFNKVLLDAPCTGTGATRRRPEIKRRIRPDDVKKLSKLQSKLLNAASVYVRKGGLLLYSTCSLLPEENEDVIALFVKNRPEFRVKSPFKFFCLSDKPQFIDRGEGIVIAPHEIDACGVFIATLERSK